MTYFQRLRRLATPAVLAAGVLLAEFGYAGMSWANASKPQVTETKVLVIANTYANAQLVKPLLWTQRDGWLIMELFSGIEASDDRVVSQHNSDQMLMQAGIEQIADCNAKGSSRLIWFSGHSVTFGANFYLMGEPSWASAQAAGKIASTDMEGFAKANSLLFSDVMTRLAKSPCKFILGLDTDPSATSQSVPNNVTVIWAAGHGNYAKESIDGGYLTRAFASVASAQQKWTPAQLTAAMRAALVPSDALNKSIGEFLPWVQGASEFRLPITKLQAEMADVLNKSMYTR